jgi:hypothetical protein
LSQKRCKSIKCDITEVNGLAQGVITLQYQELLYRISDDEVKIAAVTHDVKEIKFSCVPYKLSEGGECRKVHLAFCYRHFLQL